MALLDDFFFNRCITFNESCYGDLYASLYDTLTPEVNALTRSGKYIRYDVAFLTDLN